METDSLAALLGEGVDNREVREVKAMAVATRGLFEGARVTA